MSNESKRHTFFDLMGLESPQFANPENPSPSPWVQYKYDGNFAGNVLFRPGIVDELIKVIGEPTKPLKIESGNERIEGFNLFADMFAGWPISWGIPEWKRPFVITERKDAKVLVINSQVIDGRIQLAQRRDDFKHSEYERRFTEALCRVIVVGIATWASHEQGQKLKGKPLMARFRAYRELRDFWRKMGKWMVMGVTQTKIA